MDSVIKSIRVLGMVEEIESFSKNISGLLFSSRDNKEFQAAACASVLKRVKQLAAKNRDFNVFAMLFELHKFTKPIVVNVQLVSVQMYSTFVAYSLSVDISDQLLDLKVVQSSMGAAYDTDRLVNTRIDVFHDTINDQEFVVLMDAGVARRMPEAEVGPTEPEEHLLPVGLVAGFWPSLPSSVELLEAYAGIPAGTTLTLNPDKEMYSSGQYGIPAIMYHLITHTHLPAVPAPDSIFAPEDNEMREIDDEESHDDLNDFFNDL